MCLFFSTVWALLRPGTAAVITTKKSHEHQPSSAPSPSPYCKSADGSSDSLPTDVPACSPFLAECLMRRNVPIVLATDLGWRTYTDTYNRRLRYVPAAVVVPQNEQHISDAIICAAINGVKVQAKSGGHSYASFSTGGQNGTVIIDLENLQEISLYPDGIVKVGGGVRLGNLDLAIFNQGKRALAHGTSAGTGVGGHFTHGGYGYSSRAWGLALDQIVAMDVILADGSYIHATEKQHPEIYYAMRGAADSFGVAVNFYLQTQPAPQSVVHWSLGFHDLLKNVSNAVAVFQHIQDFALNRNIIDRRIAFGVSFSQSMELTIHGVYMGPVEIFEDTILPELLRGLAQPSSSKVEETDWITLVTGLSGAGRLATSTRRQEYNAHSNFFAKSITIPDPLSSAALANYFQYVLDKGSVAPTSWFAIINLYGGPDSQINTKDANFSAYGERDNLWVVQHYAAASDNVTFPEEGVTFVDGLNNAMTKDMPRYGAYLNYVDPSLTADQAHRLYYGEEIYGRLKKIKAKYDPYNVFANPQSI